MRTLTLFLLLACGQDPPEPGPPNADAKGQKTGPQGPDPHGMNPSDFQNLDQGQQHPPLPAENPAWDWDAGGFVSDFGWYGEHSWADVRMRLAGHLSVIGRDRARLLAQQGDFTASAKAYQELADALDGLQIPASGNATELVAHLRLAAHRDRALLSWLASDQTEPPLKASEGLDGIRQQILGLERQQLQHGFSDAQAARAQELQAALEPYLEPVPDLALDAFEDFNSRHALRVKLFEARMDSLDPLGFGDRWGYWEATELKRQALLLGMALSDLGGDPWREQAEAWLGPLPELDAQTYLAASAWAASSPAPDQQTLFTVDGLGWLPTGDSLIDVAAQPGPMAIGTLMKLGLEDPEHRLWLEAAALRLNQEMQTDPSTIPATVAAMTAELDAYGHGSRYYNIKQLRNEAVRVLSRAGRTAEARQIIQSNQPLHNQDWACPNRQGILEAIEGRILAQGGHDEASQVLDRAWKSSLDFLSLVDAAEAAGPGNGPGKRPPMMGPAGQQGPPGPPPR